MAKVLTREENTIVVDGPEKYKAVKMEENTIIAARNREYIMVY